MLENLRQVALIQETESSNRIEGIVADDKRLRAIVEEKVKPANRSESEIAGYRDVLNTDHESSHADIPFYPARGRPAPPRFDEVCRGGRVASGRPRRTKLPRRCRGKTRVRFTPVAPHVTEKIMRTLHGRFRCEMWSGCQSWIRCSSFPSTCWHPASIPFWMAMGGWLACLRCCCSTNRAMRLDGISKS